MTTAERAARDAYAIPRRRSRLEARETAARVRLASLLRARGTNHARIGAWLVFLVGGDELTVQPTTTIPIDQLTAWPEIAERMA